ncbi:polyprotein [Phytophthora megakarya]|uniref:Polyprotein n=1 Tax=Phytophthora megakarya TaxID=4795 RepID=A0A225WFT0_9STRA|nr:polyprotein [Phytophthora megakarya]
MPMLEYIQCHIVHHIAPDGHDNTGQCFISGMNAGYQRFYLTKKAPSTLEEAFAVALREAYKPKEVDAIQHYGERQQSTFSTQSPSTRTSRLKCFRCRKPCQRAAVCRAPATVVANVASENDVVVRGTLLAVNGEMVLWWQNFLLTVQCFMYTTSGSNSRLIVLSLHIDAAKRSIRALLDLTNNFVHAESLSVLPTDMSIHEGPSYMVVKYADGEPRRLPRRSATFSYECDGFRGSDDLIVIELSDSFDCIFGLLWLARHQPHIDWLTKTVCPRNIDVNAVLASLSVIPNTWPHVVVMNTDSMTFAVHEECDDPSYAACEHAACAGSEQGSQNVSNVVEQWSLRSDEQRLSGENDVVECDLSLAVEHEFPHVVERKIPFEVDALESCVPPVKCPESYH